MTEPRSRDAERPIDRLLDRLEAVRETGPGRWMARCPAHDDSTPSLSIREVGDGRLLIHCHAGCDADRVMAAAGLSLADLFPRDDRAAGHGYAPVPRRDRRLDPAEMLASLDQEAHIVYSVALSVLSRRDGLELGREMADVLARAVARIGSVRARARAAGWVR